MKNKTSKNRKTANKNMSCNLMLSDENLRLRWKYDKGSRYWWTGETVAWANDGFTIEKADWNRKSSYYRLKDGNRHIASFHQLGSAKMVAQLIRNG